jgi:hypothetical protein
VVVKDKLDYKNILSPRELEVLKCRRGICKQRNCRPAFYKRQYGKQTPSEYPGKAESKKFYTSF